VGLGSLVLACLLPALSPFMAVAAAVSLKAIGVLSLLAVPVLVLAWFSPRWFCRHGCPVGLLQELVQRARPTARRRWSRTPAVGPALVVLTFGGALLGYPLFLWLDPLAIFQGVLNAWRPPLALATLLASLGLPLLLLLEWVAPRLWCQGLCPLGSTQDLLRRLKQRLQAKRHYAEAHRRVGGIHANPGRRGFLMLFAGAAAALAVKAVRGQSSPPLRPPGSLSDQQFTGLCVRCGNCAQTCPSKIIQPGVNSGGMSGFLAPRLDFTTDYCREDCHRCNRVCPTGAIARLSLAEKQRHIIGLARVDPNNCLMVLGRECNACVTVCPYQAIAMDSLTDPFSPRPTVDPDRCNGCGACESVCPTRPLRAICIHVPASGQ